MALSLPVSQEMLVCVSVLLSAAVSKTLRLLAEELSTALRCGFCGCTSGLFVVLHLFVAALTVSAVSSVQQLMLRNVFN